MKINIRRSIPNDVYSIRKVQQETWLRTYPNKKEGITVKDVEEKFKVDLTATGKRKIEERKKIYEDKKVNTWVAEIENEIIGFCMAIKEERNNRIGAIYVSPNHQRKGLGKKLMKKALSWLGDKKNIFINVAKYNNQAINFYKKFGFFKTGESGILDRAAKLPSGKFIPEIELLRSISIKNEC